MSQDGVVPATLRVADDGWSIEVLDQTRLPHQVEVRRLATFEQVVEAIAVMRVRGAPLIGIAAAYGICLAAMVDDTDAALDEVEAALLATRPTAVNLRTAVSRMSRVVRAAPRSERVRRAYAEAAAIAEEDRVAGRAIGDHGLELLRDLHRRHHRPVNLLTHCNAGRLVTLDYGTALAPVYRAREEGIPVHVWVDETRPRAQGWLTAWELGAAQVPHTVIADTAAGHLLQTGQVDLAIVGTDRVVRNGDVCNKIGTYLVALAAREAGVPFYVACPSSSIDWTLDDGAAIPIEERSGAEVTHVGDCRVAPEGTAVRNPAFDVTPSRLVTALVTERGVCPATEVGLLSLFPAQRR
ncbi:MAG TPA: S-methyl-5-thioribose-1-phosphate isomerase [Gemmatimonadales bacterium]